MAQPVVEDYIRTNLGPAALMRDLARTAQVLARFGPHLPNAVEQALIGLREPRSAPEPRRDLSAVAWFLAGAGLAGVVALAAVLI